VGDFNHDGAPDLVVANQNDNSVSVLLNQTPVTMTALVSSSNPALSGDLLALQAAVTVAVPQAARPTGLVTFMDGAAVLGIGTLNPFGLATLETTLQATGYHAVTAVYQGDPNFTGSSSPTLEQLVNQALTAVTLTSTADPGLAGQPITFVVAVTPIDNTPGIGQPTGTVLFQEDGSIQLGSATLSNGRATFATSALTAGSHSIVAFYAGDNQFAVSLSSTLVEAVNNPAPIITNVSPDSINEGSPTFTLTINGSNFLTGSTVQWNGAPLTITELTGTQIQATVPGSLVADEGTAQVSVTNPGPGGGAFAQTFKIADAPLAASGQNISVQGNKNFSGIVATFTDSNPTATAADFSAVITWDNGTSTLGTIAGTGPFTVSGSHVFGAFANAHHVTVAISDDGGSTATVIDTVIDPIALSPNQVFVSHLYEDLLQRPAEDAGLAYWAGMLDQGQTRLQVVQGIENSTEYRSDLVQSLYSRYLHRHADPSGLAAFTQLLAGGGTVEQAASQILGSQEYYQQRGQGTAAGFLGALYQDALRRAPDPTGRGVFLLALSNGASQQQIAEAIFSSTEYRQDLVQSDYLAYLHRQADSSGLGVFTTALALGTRDEAIVADILASDEYFLKV
jgi:hypothetical protein